MQRRTALAAAAAITMAVATAVPSAMAAKKPTILWSTTAPTMQVAKTKGGYTLTMPQSSPTVWFTDRPSRTAGTTTINGFVGGWEQNRFNKVPPNAALVLRRDGLTTQTVVTLTKPKLLRNDNIRFAARVVPDGSVMDMDTMNMEVPTGRFRNAALFIDAGDAPACAAMITQPGWCTMSSSDNNSASTTVNLSAPNSANTTRTIQTCYWTGDHKVDATLTYYDDAAQWRTLTLNKDATPACNSPSFSNLNTDAATWTFTPQNHYFSSGALWYTRNQQITLTLHSRNASYPSGLQWAYSTPKIVIVVTDS